MRRLGRLTELFGGEGPDQLPCEDVGGIDERDAAEFLFGERERDLGAAEDDRVGVSGKAASRIGEVLRQSAEGHQILCITHTAQIAALADCHLLIQKNITNERTYTEIHPLDENGRVEALARLISGDHVTELSLANAREMLGRNAEK